MSEKESAKSSNLFFFRSLNILLDFCQEDALVLARPLHCQLKTTTMFTKLSLLTAFSLTVQVMAFAQNNLTMRSINNDAPVKCSKSITINASREKVWAVLTNIDNWANWQTDISKPKLNGELAPNTTFDWKTGGAKIHSTLHTVAPYKDFGWTGKTFGLLAIHNWTLSEINGKIEVSVAESMEGFLTKIFKKTFQKNLEKGMQNWLDLLKETCEQA